MTPHDPQNPENGDNFHRLLENRSEIAEFVNSFTSERVQRRAFEAVVCSLGLADQNAAEEASPVERLHIIQQPDPADAGSSEDEAGDANTSSSTQRRRRSRNGSKKSKTFAVPRGLNFAPEGHPSLEAFVEEKQPRNQYEKNLVACFYLAEMMGLTVDTEHVLAVYQAVKEWDPPAHPHTSLQNTASKHGWIDTADMKNIKVVWQGDNYVRNKMPVEPKKTG